MATFVAAGVASFLSVRQPARLGLEAEPCGSSICVSWVVPAGHAWHDGARVGMVILSVDGLNLQADYGARLASALTAELRKSTGEVFEVRVALPTTAQQRKWPAFWILGTVFAVLGSIVVLRRGDLLLARRFAVFSTFCAVGLAVGPAAGGPHPAWAHAVLFVSVIAVGATSLDFALALAYPRGGTRMVSTLSRATALAFITANFLSLLSKQPIYSVIRLPMALYVAATLIASIVIIAAQGARHTQFERRLQALICVTGIAVGTLPFVILTYVPIATGRSPLVPVEASILLLGIMPVAFTVAIMQYDMLGIRTLVHRGMVYGVITTVVLIAVSSIVGFIGPAFADHPIAIIGLVVAGIIGFYPLHLGARRLVDRFAYRDEVDPTTILGAVQSDIIAAEENQEAAPVLMQRIADALRLESGVLYLGDDPANIKPVAAVGTRHDLADKFEIPPEIYLEDPSVSKLMEFRWESNTLLLSTLVLSGRFLGFALWGPKHGGDIFVPSEKNLIAAMTPILTLVIEERILSDERRYLNERLVRSAEDERARFASDLHDGPLQKAILLSGNDYLRGDRSKIARQLVGELREVCTRLRPAILDDLGLIPALDWLVVEVPQRSDLSARLELRSVDEDQRFAPDTELALFRVTQEAINNSIKHSRGSEIRVTLSKLNGELVLNVRDNGVGFSIPDCERSGLGIPGMRERVRQLNGRISVRSDVDQGTSVAVYVPVDAVERSQ